MKNFKNILSKPTREAYPWAIWIWNQHINRQELEKQLKALISKGFGGIAIRPGRNMVPAYLSDEFLENFGFVLELAHQNNIGIRLADDFSLPWSGVADSIMNQSRKFRAEYLVLDQDICPSSENLECPVFLEAHKEYIAQAVRFSGKQALLAEQKSVTIPSDKVSFIWKAPGRDWRLLLYKKEAAEDMTGNSIPNILNPKFAQLYIQNTLEVLKNQFIKYIPTTFEGFITETPGLKPGCGAIPWDDDLVAKYRAKYKKDLLKLLPALFFTTDSSSEKVRLQVYSFIFNSMFERSASNLEVWAKKHRMSQWVLWSEKGMYRLENALSDGLVPSDVSVNTLGIQNLDGSLDSFSLLRTVADINTNEFRRETVTVIGRNRIGTGNTIQSLKREIDLSILAGPSKILMDGFFFNLDQRNYYKTPCNPAWYSPEWEHMRLLCDYSARVQGTLKDLHSLREVAVLSPSLSIMAEYTPNGSDSVRKGQTQFQNAVEKLSRINLGFDIVSEELLLSCTVRQNGEFGTPDRIRKGNYQVLVIPFAPFVSRSLLVLLEKLVSKGTKIVFLDEMPQGTYEDGISSAVTARIQKLLSLKKGNAVVCSASELEKVLPNESSEITVSKESGILADVATSVYYGEGYKIYLLHNLSESTEQAVTIQISPEKHFAAIDCANGELLEINHVEQDENNCRMKFCFSPLQTILLVASATKFATVHNASRASQQILNSFSLSQRNYRIVFKDQWSFEPKSMNVLPLANWNIRIGLSRESGNFSHFYETTFEVKNIPDYCMFVASGMTPIRCKEGFEISINGLKMERQSFSDGCLSDETAVPINRTIGTMFGNNAGFYDIQKRLVKGMNRVSIRTTGVSADPQPILYPPLVMGTFSISKGTHGLALDSQSTVIGNDSWTKYGYPYLSGKGVYRQSFEVPNEYDKLVLRLSKVSGTVFVKINETDLGSFHWHPMEIDITPYCSSKRNELSIEVVNTVDNVLRMNGRPSGLTGEVFIDVY